ncbi:hypothetical protein PUN28_000403 [Cardiocondyla obscurior]
MALAGSSIKHAVPEPEMIPESVIPTETVEEMLKKTGCLDLHHEVLDCISKLGDWRKCQTEVKKFKLCMDKYVMSKEPNGSGTKDKEVKEKDPEEKELEDKKLEDKKLEEKEVKQVQSSTQNISN